MRWSETLLMPLAVVCAACGSPGLRAAPADAVAREDAPPLADLPAPCPGSLQRCGGACVDLTRNPDHCGLCGYRCGPGPCNDGVCAVPSCRPPSRMCLESCVDVTRSTIHCGACAHACAAGQQCVEGACLTGNVGAVVVAPCAVPGPDPACAKGLACASTDTTPVCSAACEDRPDQPSERAACGDARSTCLTRGDPPTARSSCATACRPGAAGVAAGGCRAGFVCTGWWFTHAQGRPDAPGCAAFCASDADCGEGAPGPICHVRTGVCGRAAVDSSRLPDGSPCDPTATEAVPGEAQPRNVQCRGSCFASSPTDPTRGVCGSIVVRRASPACPDAPDAMEPAGFDDLGLCLFRLCSHNSDCASPHLCRYPEDGAGTPVTTTTRVCDYPTAAQPTGAP
ncbi:MAG: hypothetical protein U0324_21245 [Polyangiales bacterium]